MRLRPIDHRWNILPSILSDTGGMALVLMLLVLAIIAALVVEFSYGVYISTHALHNWQTSQRLSLLAKSGLKLTLKALSNNDLLSPYTYPGTSILSHNNPFEDFEGTLSSRIEDENSKFNVNTLVFPNGLLNERAYHSFLRLLDVLSLSPTIADRIVDWIDPDREPRVEDSENGAKNAFLDSVDEILLIQGVDKKSYENLFPYITIYGDGRININGAEIPVLMSLSDSIDETLAERIVRYREIAPFEKAEDIFNVAGFKTIGTSLMGRIAVKGTIFRVISTAEEDGIKKVIESVLELSGGSPTIRYWKEI